MAYPEYYQIMGVEPDASPEEIKQAYIRLVKKYHPDTHQGDVKAEEKLKKINEAYDTLKDLAKRAEYDYYGMAGYAQTDSAVAEKNSEIHEDTSQYANSDYGSEIKLKRKKKKHIFAKLFILVLLLFYVFFMYAARDVKYSQNVAMAVHSGSEVLYDISKTVTQNAAKKLSGSQLVKNTKESLIWHAVKNNKFYLTLSMLKICSPDTADEKNHGRTLLMEARQAEIIELLINSGANVNLFDDSGETALTLAVRRQDAVAAELLLQAGAEVNYILPSGETPLQIAAGNNDTVMMIILQGHGAKLMPKKIRSK